MPLRIPKPTPSSPFLSPHHPHPRPIPIQSHSKLPVAAQPRSSSHHSLLPLVAPVTLPPSHDANSRPCNLFVLTRILISLVQPCSWFHTGTNCRHLNDAASLVSAIFLHSCLLASRRRANKSQPCLSQANHGHLPNCPEQKVTIRSRRSMMSLFLSACPTEPEPPTVPRRPHTRDQTTS